MTHTRILLLKSGEAGGLGGSLRNILETEGAHEFQLTEELLPGVLPGACPAIPSRILARRQPDLVAVCLGPEGLRQYGPTFASLLEQLGATPVVLIAEEGDPKQLDDMIHLGVMDFILSPLRSREVLHRLFRLRRQAAECCSAVRGLKERLGLKQFIGESEAMMQEILQIPKLAQSDVSVLIGGETGTGKEMVARAIHHLSSRCDNPFVAVNCGTLPDDLVENELFGHEPGAFTGATSPTFGLLHEADGGTIFLDEIDTLPLKSQAKLLRFLQEREYRPLGSTKTCKANVRVLAASNASIEQLLQCGRFRTDLYYRLNVVPLHLPALRDRKEDIPLLAQHILAKHSLAHRKPAPSLSPAAMQKLIFHTWPGNIRELENLLERALILSTQPLINGQDICLPLSFSPGTDACFKTLKANVIADFERNYIQHVLVAHDGNISNAAKAARKHRRAFWQLMQKHHIPSPSQKISSRPAAPVAP